MMRLQLIVVLLTTALFAFASDQHCPAYPTSERAADSARIRLERSSQALSFDRGKGPRPQALSLPFNNFIDEQILGTQAVMGIEHAPKTNDAEFLRRVSLDLTGRIPEKEQIGEFVLSTNPHKREDLIDSLMNSESFIDYWTFLLANKFEVTSRYYNFIGIPGRNLFYNFLRDFVARDRSYAEVAREMITATGDSHKNGAANFLIRGFQQGDPIQDTWDAIADRITSRFLGVKSECVSCHNGARHLEEINLYLSARTRREFWQESAFLARTSFNQLPVDAFNQQWHFLLNDRSSGVYNGVVDPNNPGPRPPRSGVYMPAYMLTREQPATNDWRGELARMVTSDRQFARATVNWIWAHFFKYGIVDPPEGWDLARLDPKNPPPAPWALQPSHPYLLEMLTDEFIRSNYSIRRVIRLIAETNAYQLSSSYPYEWKPEYERYFAKHFPRRLFPEEIYDAAASATMTETPMFLEGFDKPLTRAIQLPDSIEPMSDGRVTNFLSNLGRGDWWQTPRRTETTVLEVLYFMNDNNVNFRTFGSRGVTTRVSRIVQSGIPDVDAVNTLFLATLGRWASEEEYQTLLRNRTGSYEQWLSDIQWALLNKLEFIFNE
jgi:hypothetical protein